VRKGFVLGALLLLLIAGITGATNVMKVWLNINADDVSVYLNGLPLDDEINDLRDKYDALSNYIELVDSDVYDYILLNEIKSRLLSKHIQAISYLQQELMTNESLSDEEKQLIISKIREHNSDMLNIQNDADNKLIKILLRYERRINEGEDFSYGGYYDVNGNFRHFKEEDDRYTRDDVFRITNCYSELGISKVLQGGWITIEGINSYGIGVSSNSKMKVIYFDPVKGDEKTYAFENGDNLNYSDTSIRWIGNAFILKLKIDKDTIGMKQVTIKRFLNGGGEEEEISVVFDVIRPNLNVFTVSQNGKVVVSVNTNLNKIKISYGDEDKTIRTINGRTVTIFDAGEGKEVIVSGTDGFEWVKTKQLI